MLSRRPGLRVGLLLTPPMLWLGVAYLGALAALLITALWTQNDFTGNIERTWTLENFHDLFTIDVYRTITFRTIGIAALVTVIDAVLAFPIALFMAKVASPRFQRLLVIAVLMPLWASYLVKAYAWRGMLSSNGIIEQIASPFGLGTPGYGLVATTVTLAYLWLPFMILPIYAGPGAGARLAVRGVGRPRRRLRGRRCAGWCCRWSSRPCVAGSIFTFSLSMGDYIAVKIVGGTSQLLGNVVYDNQGAANNLPFAAAVATIPIVVMLAFLAAARRTGALEQL